MTITYRMEKDAQIFDIEGNITFEDTAELEAYILIHIQQGCTRVVVNLANTSYLTSSALGSFVRIHQTIKEKGIILSMMNVSKEIENLFSITGVNRYFDVIPSGDGIQ
jgi:anti-sigma B factor antagonist